MTPQPPPEITEVYYNKARLQKMPMEWMECSLAYIQVKLQEIKNRATLPENQNPDANGRLQRQGNRLMAIQYRMGEEMNRRGKNYLEMIMIKPMEGEEDGSDS